MTKYLTLGDRAIVVEFGQIISQELNEIVMAFRQSILLANIIGITEVFPSYKALTVIYDPIMISYKSLITKLKEAEQNMIKSAPKPPNIIEIPVCYNGKFAPDIDFVADYHKITADEVIKLHTSKPYLIYMLGFMPGFAFLGELDKTIHMPRHKSPRTKVPPGSIGITGAQTCMYAIESPGGLQLIGRTPLKLFDPSRENPVAYKAGDFIKFVSITSEQYYNLEEVERYDC